MNDQQSFELDMATEREKVSVQIRALQWQWTVKYMVAFYTYRRDNAQTQEEFNRYQEALETWAKSVV